MTPLQCDALFDCHTHANLRRTNAGWAHDMEVLGHHSFVTVHSLIKRGFMEIYDKKPERVRLSEKGLVEIERQKRNADLYANRMNRTVYAK